MGLPYSEQRQMGLDEMKVAVRTAHRPLPAVGASTSRLLRRSCLVEKAQAGGLGAGRGGRHPRTGMFSPEQGVLAVIWSEGQTAMAARAG